MDLFDKLTPIARLREELFGSGPDPFNVCIQKVRSATEAVIDGRDVILAGTNNYLGLTFDPRCMEEARAAIASDGTGTTGSRIASGTYAHHRALERRLAEFLNRASVLVFTTGYQANLGTLCGLAGPKDFVFIDADCHASIYDGCRLSGASIIRFRHNDPADLDKRLGRLDPSDSNKLVVVEGIYSMLGDRAPLAEIVEVKRKHNAYLLVDEAHSLGVLGGTGRGLAEETGVETHVDFITGTFSKSLGAIGGFCASDHPVLETLRVTSRPFMYTASPPSSIMASVQQALTRLADDPELKARLWENIGRFHQGIAGVGLTPCSPPGPIIAIRVPSPEQAILMWRKLLGSGVYVNLAIPPGTPNGISLLRCSVSATHTPRQIETITSAFAEAARELSLVGTEEQQVAQAGG